MKRDPDPATAPMLGLGSHVASNILRLDTAASAAAAGGMPYHALVDTAATSCLNPAQRNDRKSSHTGIPMAGRVGEFKTGLNPMAGMGGGRGGMGPVAVMDDGAERPYPCHFCEARFKKKQHLQNHERIHTGEKYVCTLCGQAFSRMHILKHHLERKHAEPPQTPLYHLDS
ncbi:hypothetical protein Pcinc_022610 [Petrolisthes cinctipes]|uniref:C2H2-type domain-containing protein n=1 Tax=Petrolisthes cinctipes TaxID=88211 RepID=A0AAE1FDV7_PETCI|nr:hypothetical protein Pcinc_022610 [Petrolisthes cinctipes]